MRSPILLIFLFGFSIIYDVEAYPTKHEPADNSVYGIEHCVHMTPENEEKISSIVVKLSEYLYNLTIEHEAFDIRLLKIVIEGHSDDEVEEKDTQIQLVVNDCYHSDESADAEQLQDFIVEEDPTEKEGTIVVDFVDTEDEQSGVDDKNDDSASPTDDNASEDISNDTQTQIVENNSSENDIVTDNSEESTVNNKNDDSASATNDNASEDISNDTQTQIVENNSSENDIVTDNSEESTGNNNQTTSATLNQSERYATDNVESGNSGIDIDDIQPSSAANYDVQGPVLVRLDLDKNGNKLIRGTQVKRGEHVPLILYVQKVLGNVEYLFAN